MSNFDTLYKCNLCIRNCNVNRLTNELGFCKASNLPKVARAELHHWEEPCLSGNLGSGTVFFSNCNLQCAFCQNHEISYYGNGVEISVNRLANIFLELQFKGAHNINLVTPTHYVPLIIEALKISKSKGLNVPIIYNTNSLDSLQTIKSLNGFIDVYLPDFKYFDHKYSMKYSKISNYSDNVINVIREMLNQVGKPLFKDGLMQKGVIVRHLLLPSLLFDSKKIIDTLYKNFGDDIYISFMNQYTPLHKAKDFPEINKPLNPKHYDSLINYALSLGVKKGFIQDEGTNSINYVPSFNNEGVL